MYKTEDGAQNFKGKRASVPHRVIQIIGAGEYGGAEVYVRQMMIGARESGVATEALVFYDRVFAARLREDGFVVDVEPSLTRVFWRLRERIEAGERLIIHTHGVKASLLGRAVGERTGTPVVTTIHSDLVLDYQGGKGALFRALERMTRGMSARIVAVSEPLAEILRERGYDPARIRVIAPGVAVGALEKEADETTGQVESLRERLGIPKDAWVVVCVARLHAVKDHETLIRAVSGLAEVRGRSVALLLVGDGEERKRLEELSATHAPGRVYFAGAVEQVRPYLELADVFALASRMEGFGLAAAEAMAAGLPVIVSDVGGLCQVAPVSGVQGIRVAPGDVDGFFAALKSLLEDDALREHMAKEGQTYAMTELSTERMRAQLAQLYEEIARHEQ
ncbi:glycosyltransferase [Ferroacidibacillus organovorans]|uniref:Glycosyl transferase n=1 Tax=Ferroacidibacillus organovorans TaxID=1765683 RepID=A0A101XPI7_9BACL|nr:glycosyltransferase [Ferroacidibacillus organovorans]KUO95237.1 hypothetical protein ATW55_13950 [Ferroacidibacillus organovorans]